VLILRSSMEAAYMHVRDTHLLWASPSIDQIREHVAMPASSGRKQRSRAIERSASTRKQLSSLIHRKYTTNHRKVVTVCQLIRSHQKGGCQVERYLMLARAKCVKSIKSTTTMKRYTTTVYKIGWLSIYPTFPSACIVRSVGKRFMWVCKE